MVHGSFDSKDGLASLRRVRVGNCPNCQHSRCQQRKVDKDIRVPRSEEWPNSLSCSERARPKRLWPEVEEAGELLPS